MKSTLYIGNIPTVRDIKQYTVTWIYIDISAFLTVAVLAGFIIPQILLIAFRKNLFDETDPRKIHKGTVPRLGGIAFFPSILFAFLLVLGICMLDGDKPIIEVFMANLASFSFIFCATIVLYLTGMADDLVSLKYRAKFVAQIFASGLIIIGGALLDNLHGFLCLETLPTAVAVILTLLLTVFITNAINLIDGIDGLASGLSAIACAFYGCVCYDTGLYAYSVLAFATLGSLVPFFYYNVFGNAAKHSKIFMGDTGALTIGLILSVLAIKICSLPDSPSSLLNPSSLRPNVNLGAVAFAPLLIPCCDVVRVYLHRIKQHRSPFLPDKSHIHHKLLALGMTQRAAMPTIVLASVILTALNYWLSAHINITLLFICDLALWIIANTILSRAIRRRQLRTGIIIYK